MKKRILVIIPCYNEEASLPGVLEAIAQLADPDITVLVVNDCSRDATAAIARKHKVKLLDLPINLGIGGAMQSGYKYALRHGFDLAIQVDGDGQHMPSELAKLISHHNETGDQVVVGSRFMQKTTYKSTISRRTGIYYFHLLNKILLGRNLYDCTSGFRLFDKEAIAIAARLYPDEYPEPESLILFSRLGLRIAEVPVIMQQRQGGTSSIGSISGIYYMIKVTIAMLFSFIRNAKR